MSDPRPAVPFGDLWAAGLRTTWGDELRAWRAIQERGIVLAGPEVAAFELEWATRVGAAQGIAVASGTAALMIALRAAGIGLADIRDGVLVPAYTCPATAAAVLAAGGVPVLVDVDPHTGLMDPDHAEAVLGAYRDSEGVDIAAIVPVHLFGRLAPVAPLEVLAEAIGAVVIEDAAQAHGLAGVGTNSWAAAYSFYPTKNLGARGDAGAITTDDPVLADACRRLRQYGAAPGWEIAEWGWCERMDEVQAASLRVQLPRLGVANHARALLAAEYRLRLPRGIEAGWDTTPSVHHIFPLRVHQDRDAFRAALRASGVETGVHYPKALMAYPQMCAPLPCPHAEQWAQEEVSLPCYPGLRGSQVEAVIAAVSAAVSA